MYQLNLANPDKSDFLFEVQYFPDGQQDVRITGLRDGAPIELDDSEEIYISSRFNSWKDLELILAAKAALRRMVFTNINLYIPYLLGARSDRKFVAGGTSYLVDVVTPVLRAANFGQIVTMDVHSDVAAACLPNIENSSIAEVVKWAIEQSGSTNYALAIPDAGALKKFYGLAQEIKYTGPVLVGQKHRDLASGKIVSTSVEYPGAAVLDEIPDIFIVDDICDGGRTFIELVKAIKAHEFYQGNKFYLVVTHGIFSAGYKELNDVFSGIYCTNSVKDVESSWSDGYHDHKTGVTQFNIF